MTSLSLPSARRRFIAMLWLSLALHAALIGLTRLPPKVAVPLPSELQVELAPRPPAAQPAPPMPEPRPAAKPPARQARRSPPAPPSLPQAISPPQPLQQAAPATITPPPPMPAPPASAAAPGRDAPGPALDVPLLADSRYYTAKELDVQPSALRRPEPVYPSRAEEQGVAGRVVIRLHLEADGGIGRIEVVSVTPGGAYGEMFRKATLDSLKATRFRPAQRNGQPVRAVVEIPIVFEPDE